MKLRRTNFLRLLSRFSFLLLILCGALKSFAQDTQAVADSNKFGATGGAGTSSEAYDPRSGTMTIEIPLVSVPGPNDMSIGASVSFNKTSYSNSGLSYWSLEIPKLVSPDTYTGICDNLFSLGPTLVLPGQAPRVFFRQMNSPVTSALYMTSDKWTLNCVSSPNAITAASSPNTYIDYVVRSPSGLIYNFFHQPAVAVAGGNKMYPNSNKLVNSTGFVVDTPRQPAYVFASSVQDLYGNTINYHYNIATYTSSSSIAGIFGEPQLTSISTSDGRSMTFNYATNTTSNVIDFNNVGYTITRSLLTSVTSNGKSWTFAYDTCFDSWLPSIGSACSGSAPLLRTITRPDGHTWKFKYTYERTGDSSYNYFFYRPGINFVVSEIVYPNGLTSDFGYSLYTPGAMYPYKYSPTLFYASSMPLLTSRTYSGTGLTSPITTTYQYFVPNYTNNTNCTFDADGNIKTAIACGDRVSLTFAYGPTKLTVYKYRRDNIGYPSSPLGYGGVSLPVYGGVPTGGSFDNGMLIETAILPLPPSGAISMTSQASQAPASLPPTIAFNSVSENYLSSYQPITIGFTTGGSNPIASANFAVDSGAPSVNKSFTSATLPLLANGRHTLTVQVTDTAGATAQQTTPIFNVGSTGVNGFVSAAASNDCSFNGQTVGNGASVTAYQANQVSYGQVCESQNRTCVNGVLTGQYSYSFCNSGPLSESSCWGALEGSQRRFYQATNVLSGQTCQSEVDTCVNGSFTGSYRYNSCAVVTALPPATTLTNLLSIDSLDTNYPTTAQPITVNFGTFGGAGTANCSVDGGAYSACPTTQYATNSSNYIGHFTLPTLALGTHTVTIQYTASGDTVVYKATSNPFTIVNTTTTASIAGSSTLGTMLPLGHMSFGFAHSCWVTSQATVQCWGASTYGQLGMSLNWANIPTSVPGLTGIKSVAAEGHHTCAVTTSGAVYCWGINNYGEAGISPASCTSCPPTLVAGVSGVTSMALTDSQSCALTSAGTVYCWGFNGTVTTSTPTLVSGLSGIVAMSGSSNHLCFLSSAGSVQCMGTNAYGELGNGTTTASATPVAVGLSGVKAIASGGYSAYNHTCALTSSGSVYCWGFNGSGQLGNLAANAPYNGFAYSASPVAVTGLSTVVAVAAGAMHSCAMLNTGAVKCWGDNSYGQVGNGNFGYPEVNVPTSVLGLTGALTGLAAGSYHTCVSTSQGELQCWGNGTSGQLGNGYNLNSAMPVVAPPPLAPTVTISSPSSIYAYVNQPITIAFTSSAADGLLGSLCSIDNGPFLPCTSSTSDTLPVLAPGAHTLTVEAIDVFGDVTRTNSSPFTVLAVGQCYFNGTVFNAGGTTTAYTAAVVPYGSTCTTETLTCTSGAMSPAGGSATCSVTPPAPCSFNGVAVASGASITAYLASSVASGSACTSQSRLCTNGTLSGSYAYSSCVVNCLWNGSALASGSTATGYTASSVSYLSTCASVSETVTCTNGVITPSGASATCSVQPIPAPVATAAVQMNSAGFSVTFNTLPGATAYYLDVSKSNTFATILLDYNNLLLTSPAINLTNASVTYPVTGLAASATYYYRVRASNGVSTSVNSATIAASTLPNTGGGCFVAGTLVDTPSGPRPIDQLKVGDKVYSYDVETGKTVIGEIGRLFFHAHRKFGRLVLADGTTLDVTPEHRFFVPARNEWVAIGELRSGDYVLKGHDNAARPTAILYFDTSDPTRVENVYNFHVKKYLNYYVRGVLVHNVKL